MKQVKCKNCGDPVIQFFHTWQCLRCDKNEIALLMEEFNSGVNIPGYYPYDKNMNLNKALDIGLHIPDKLQKHPFIPCIKNDEYIAYGRGGYNILDLRTVVKDEGDDFLEEDLIHLKLAVGGMHEYDKVLPVSVLIYFLFEHLERYDGDISKFFEDNDENDNKGYIDYKAEYEKCKYKDRIRNAVITDNYIQHDDPRIAEDKEYSVTEPRFIIEYTASSFRDNEFDYNMKVCIDEEQVSPYYLEHLHDLFGDTSDPFLGTKEGIYLVKVKSIDEKSYCYDYACYEYDSYLEVLEFQFICDI
jgi:hypothetical protein